MIEELAAFAAPQQIMRIAPEQDVPLTPRIRRLLDTTAMQRLTRVSQLGLVARVYPGAVHTRFEHSVGVYRAALLVLQRLSIDASFRDTVDEDDAGSFLAAALLHDVGHWPFCHPIEDMRLEDLPRHEQVARRWLEEPELAELLERDFAGIEPIVRLLDGPHETPAERLLASLLSGPVDVDKLDYLIRDSVHAGVPYGRHFDVGRLIGSLCVHPESPRLAIGEKGRTAAEMMVFARYVMFSEVYWHHAVRAATAMLQRSLFLLRERLDLTSMVDLDETAWIARLRRIAEGSTAESLVAGLFGRRRVLWKRVAEFTQLQQAELHTRLARRPYWWLVACSQAVAEVLSARLSLPLGPSDVIIDAPPVKLEVDIDMDVVGRDDTVHSLAQVSPVVDALARRQFDNHVKRVRVFVRPDLRERLPDGRLDPHDLQVAIERTAAQIV